MTDKVIEFEGVSKKFSRDLKKSLYYGVVDIGKSLLNEKVCSGLRPSEFYALDNISFSLKEGENLGFIGHNGAGKTTALKLINGLLRPDAGTIRVRGKISALIALGAGFNPILTGRENIKISAAAFGYTEEEINGKTKEIIKFSEIGEFIDSPVQSYSSGMLARLGFSVAIHTTPDILLVDEVLAVGDLSFVIKCFKKIQEFKNSGGSIILVSHNIYTIRANCNHALWIENGKMQMYGDAGEVCDAYEDFVNSKIEHKGDSFVDSDVNVSNIGFDEEVAGDELNIQFNLESAIKRSNILVMICIFTLSGVNVASTIHTVDSIKANASYKIHVLLKDLRLARGHYFINMVVAEDHINNQLVAFTNKYKFNVIKETKNLGAGIFVVDSVFSANEAG